MWIPIAYCGLKEYIYRVDMKNVAFKTFEADYLNSTCFGF